MEPIEIHVRLSPDDEVLALRARVAELEAQAGGQGRAGQAGIQVPMREFDKH
ncbi:MAG: hypothetical protein ACLRIS_01930 [Flavonifractor plautii]